MKRSKLKITLFAAAVLIFMSACSRETTPAEVTAAPESPEISITENAPAIEGYEIITAALNGKTADYGYCAGKELYLSPDCLLELAEMEYSETAGKEKAVIDGSGFYIDFVLTAETGKPYLQINGRYFYTPDGWLTADNRIFLPAELIEKVFSVDVGQNRSGTVDINTDGLEILQGGEDYYRYAYNIDDLHWLSHIIEAEADTQPLEGMIGVGNVVLNRVESEDFPDTIYGVIFDFQNAPQFSPVASDALSRDVCEEAQIAAYLCLEGYNTVGESLFFQSPYGLETNWIAYSRDYNCTIGDLDFYY